MSYLLPLKPYYQMACEEVTCPAVLLAYIPSLLVTLTYAVLYNQALGTFFSHLTDIRLI
jgi:hypothetical protein